MILESELDSFLFYDLETSSEFSCLEELKEKNERKCDLWKIKVDKSNDKNLNWGSYEDSYKTYAPLYPEFGRIVCGSFMYVYNCSDEKGKMIWKGKMKSFLDDEKTDTSEKKLVVEPISKMLNNIQRSGKIMRLCGHNIKKFDNPWLIKRMIKHEILVPSILQTWNKKPWEITHLDTAELWSLGYWEGYVTLDLLSCFLDIQSPKSFLKGEYVGQTFWIENDYDKIRRYCEEDVKCVGRICHRLSGSVIPFVI